MESRIILSPPNDNLNLIYKVLCISQTKKHEVSGYKLSQLIQKCLTNHILNMTNICRTLAFFTRSIV